MRLFFLKAETEKILEDKGNANSPISNKEIEYIIKPF